MRFTTKLCAVMQAGAALQAGSDVPQWMRAARSWIKKGAKPVPEGEEAPFLLQAAELLGQALLHTLAKPDPAEAPGTVSVTRIGTLMALLDTCTAYYLLPHLPAGVLAPPGARPSLARLPGATRAIAAAALPPKAEACSFLDTLRAGCVAEGVPDRVQDACFAHLAAASPLLLQPPLPPLPALPLHVRVPALFQALRGAGGGHTPPPQTMVAYVGGQLTLAMCEKGGCSAVLQYLVRGVQTHDCEGVVRRVTPLLLASTLPPTALPLVAADLTSLVQLKGGDFDAVQHAAAQTMLRVWRALAAKHAASHASDLAACQRKPHWKAVTQAFLSPLLAPWEWMFRFTIDAADSAAPQTELLLSAETCHRILMAGVVTPEVWGTLTHAAAGWTLALAHLSARGVSATSALAELLTAFLRNAPAPAARAVLVFGLTGQAFQDTAAWLPRCASKPGSRLVFGSPEGEGQGGVFVSAGALRSAPSHGEQHPLVAILPSVCKSSSQNEHLAAEVFNDLLREYVDVRRAVASAIAGGGDLHTALPGAEEVVGGCDDGGTPLMVARSTTRRTATPHPGQRSLQSTQALLRGLLLLTEQAGPLILRSAAVTVAAIRTLLQGALDLAPHQGDASDGGEDAEELLTLCLGLLTAMLAGGISATQAADVRQLRSTLPALAALRQYPAAHVQEMSAALFTSVLSLGREGEGVAGEAEAEALDALRARVHTNSTMLLEREAAFRGGALADLANMLEERPAQVRAAGLVQHIAALAHAQLGNGDSFVYSAAQHVLATCTAADAGTTLQFMLASLQRQPLTSSRALKEVEALDQALPAAGVALASLAPAAIAVLLRRATQPLPARVAHVQGRLEGGDDGAVRELEARAGYLSVTGRAVEALAGTCPHASCTVPCVAEVVEVAAALLLRGVKWPSPAMAAAEREHLPLFRRTAAHVLWRAVGAIPDARLGDEEVLSVAGRLATVLDQCYHVCVDEVEKGHVSVALGRLRELVVRSTTVPGSADKPAKLVIGLRGSRVQ